MIFLFKKIYFSVKYTYRKKNILYIEYTSSHQNILELHVISLKKIISHLSHLSNFPPLSSSPFVPTHGLVCPALLRDQRRQGRFSQLRHVDGHHQGRLQRFVEEL